MKEHIDENGYKWEATYMPKFHTIVLAHYTRMQDGEWRQLSSSVIPASSATAIADLLRDARHPEPEGGGE